MQPWSPILTLFLGPCPRPSLQLLIAPLPPPQIMSTEDVRDPRCDALEAAMHCTDLLLHDRHHDR